MLSVASLGRIMTVVMLALQSPFMVSKTGSGISSVGILTKFLVEGAKKEGNGLSEQAHMVLRALNWPAHMLEECALLPLSGADGNCDPIFVWERAIPHAVKSTSFWNGLADQHKQVLFGGAASMIFGAIVSLVTGRTHLLAILGAGLTGYGIHLNGLVPTFQFVIVFLAGIFGIRSRAKKDFGTGPGPTPSEDRPTNTKAPGGSQTRGKKDSKKTK